MPNGWSLEYIYMWSLPSWTGLARINQMWETVCCSWSINGWVMRTELVTSLAPGSQWCRQWISARGKDSWQNSWHNNMKCSYLDSDISQTYTKYTYYYDSVHNVLHAGCTYYIVLHDHSYNLHFPTLLCVTTLHLHVLHLCLQLIMWKTSILFLCVHNCNIQ